LLAVFAIRQKEGKEEPEPQCLFPTTNNNNREEEEEYI
jgi:hypothetical protein